MATSYLKIHQKREEMERFCRNIYEGDRQHNNQESWKDQIVHSQIIYIINIIRFPPIEQMEVRQVIRNFGN